MIILTTHTIKNIHIKKDIFQWDIYNWSKTLPIWEEIVQKVKPQKTVAFGEREGGLSLWLALQGINVICTDYNEFPEAIPLKLHVKHKAESFISYEKQDVTNTSYKNGEFDLVIFKSVIGALGNIEYQKNALTELYRILKPGGVLLFAENARATKMHQFARRKFTNWGERWYYPSHLEFKTLLQDFSKYELKSFGFFGTFGRTEKQRSFLGKIDTLIHPIIPNSWKYIKYGYAIK